MEVGQQEKVHIGCSREEETAISLVMKVVIRNISFGAGHSTRGKTPIRSLFRT